MKLLIKLFLFIIPFINSGLVSFAQDPSVITKVTKFKPPLVKSYLGINTNGAAVTKEEASQLITLPLKVTDDKKNVYTIDSYHFLYKRKSVIQDEETGKKSTTFTNLADLFKTTPLPKVWIDNLKDGFQKDEELYFFDIIVKDSKNRQFFCSRLKDNCAIMKSIRAADLSDLPVIHDLAYEIWPLAYGEILSADQLKYMLDKIYSLPSLHNQLLNLHHNFIIALDNNVPVGFASFSPKEENSSVFHLHKIYVLPGEQGGGTGKMLLEYVVNSIKEKGATSLTLNVNRYNKARFFYEKKSFVITREEDIDIGEGYYMNDYIMELSFK